MQVLGIGLCVIYWSII